MPKKAVSPDGEMNRHFLAAIERQKVLRDMTDTDVSAVSGIKFRTYCERKVDPGGLRLFELRRLVKSMNLTGREVCEIIGVKYESPPA